MTQNMPMLLRNVSVVELGSILRKHAECSSAPQLVDPAARDRARENARANGVWETLEREFDPSRDIPVFKRSVFRHFKRTGDRSRHEHAEGARSGELDRAALALWLEHPKGDLDYLQDLLWAYCDDWTWVMAAHAFTSVDLGAAMRAVRLAEILHALKDQIEPEVADRVHAEIERRIFKEVSDYTKLDFWHTARMNWNHVCNGCVIRAALLEISNPGVLARFIHPLIQNMTYALDGFTDDGGCEEGPSYWGYGFGHYVQAAYALHARTGGELNIMAHDKMQRICRYPLAVHLHGGHSASFADSSAGGVALLTALQINHFHTIPELYELCPRRDAGERTGAGALRGDDMHALALYQGETATGRTDPNDYLLPDLGVVKMRGALGDAPMAVAAIAGNNGVPHNHNDVGSFVVNVGGRMVLTDPGAPLYNAKTFSDRRYEIFFCRSRGHSVPLINGLEQQAGSEHRGELSVEGLNQPGTKKAVIDMTRAYPSGTVQQLIRTLTLDAETNSLMIEDAYRFANPPEAVEEAFITFEQAEVSQAGDAVGIGAGNKGFTLSACQPGRFSVEQVTPEPEHTKPGTPLPIRRIAFVPSELHDELVLRFALTD